MTCTLSSPSLRRNPLCVRLAGAFGLLVLLGLAQAEGQGICDRTPQVRDAILKRLDTTDCATVTAADLARITVLGPNSVDRLRAGDFRGLVNLESLFLKRIGLTELQAGVFDGLSLLRDLKLHDNPLTSLPDGVFDGLTQLESLSLHQTNLTELPPGAFRGVPRLRTLSLYETEISSIRPDLFDTPRELTRVNLRSNNLTSVPAGVFRGQTKLKILLLGNNHLLDLPPSIFDGLSSLEELGLDGNLVTELDPEIFHDLRSLKSLGLSHNLLETLPEGLFENLTLLETLLLRANRLTSVPGDIFRHLSNLKWLELQRNRSQFGVPLVFERGIRSPDGAIPIRVRRVVPRRYPLTVELSAADGAVSESTVTIGALAKYSEIVVWTPARPTASVTAAPASVRASFYSDFGHYSVPGSDFLASTPRPGEEACPGPGGSGTAVCLLDERFQFSVDWRSQYDGSQGVGTLRQLTDESAVATFFDEENVELVFKLLDGRGLNRHFWVFYGALSDVEYTLSVTDRETGEFKEYRNPPGEICGRGDTTAFSAGSSTASFPASGLPDRVGASLNADCPAGALCLQDGRFQVTATWSDPAKGETGVGTPIPDTDSAGYMWFFSPGNIELVLKVLDGRWLNDSWWVYASALTDVDYAITVLDTHTGASRTYTNNPARPFCGFGDIGAFPE